MSAIKTQPTVIEGIDPYWFSRGLSCVYIGNKLLWSRNSAVKLPLTIGGTPKTVPSPVGISTGFGGTYGTGTTDLLTGPPLPHGGLRFGRSVVSHVYKNGNGGGGFGRIYDAGGTVAGSDYFYNGSSNFLTYAAFHSALGTHATWTSTHTIPTGRMSVQGFSLELTLAPKSAYFYQDGKRTCVIAGANTGVYAVDTTSYRRLITIGNRASDSARNWDGWIGSILIFDGVPLTDAEHATLAANPWQVFAQPRRNVRLSPVAAGGDVSVALSGVLGTASLGSLLASTATPLSGVLGTLSAGTVAPSNAVSLSGVSGTLSLGALTAEAAPPDRKVRQVPRTRQPLNYTELDANNPLTKGAYAWTPRVPFMWAGGRPVRRALSELNAVIGASGDGITRRWTSVAQSGIDFGVNPLITQSNGISALVIGAPATGTSRCIVSQRLTATPTVGLDLLYNDDGQGGGSSGSIALRTYAAGYKAVSATSQVDGTRHVWVLSNSAGTGFVLRDGVEQTLASNTRLSGTSAELTQQLRVGNFADFAPSGFQTSESISLVIVWDRALTVTEARKIAANPWQIFKPEERVVFAAGPPSPDVTVALSGVLGTLSLGAYTLTSAVPLTGVLGTGSVGALLPVSSFAATGVSGALSTGALLADTAVPLTGLASTISVGTLTAETGTVVALTGVSGTLSTGTLGVELSVPLAGVVGTSAAGTVGPVTALAATGVEGTLAVGSVLPAFSIPLTGEAITTSIGTMVVSGGTVTVALIGVSTTVSLGSLTALAVDGWTPIPTPQTPGWVAVSNTQTPLWTPIIDTQTPGWTPIIT